MTSKNYGFAALGLLVMSFAQIACMEEQEPVNKRRKIEVSENSQVDLSARYNQVLENVDNLNQQAFLYFTPLMYALGYTDDQEFICQFIRDTDGEAQCIDGCTALMIASCRGLESIVERILLTTHAGINLKNNAGETALVMASHQGHRSIVALLEKHGALPMSENNTSELLMVDLTSEDQTESALIALGNNHRRASSIRGREIFIKYAPGNQIQMSDLSEFAKAEDLAELDLSDFTNVVRASENAELIKKSTFVDSVLEKVKKLNAQNNCGITPLMYVLKEKIDRALFNFFIDSSDINAQNSEGLTALVLAATQKGLCEEVAILLERKADTDTKDYEYGQTALMKAAKNGFSDVVAQLLAAGADDSLRDNNGKTALMHAVKHHHIKSVKLLINTKNSTVIIQNNKGQTALAIAKRKKFCRITRLLIQAQEKFSINQQS